jgi:hypothetical protein
VRQCVLLLVLVASAALLAAGCGSKHRVSAPPITVRRVDAAFHPAPSHLTGIVVLRNLQVPLPYGDRASYGFDAAKSLKEFESQHVRLIPASLTVFSTVGGAQRASIRILKGGECLAHPDKGLAAAWTGCDHLRVANVLLLMSSDSGAAHRKTLVAALHQLGTPTRS